MINLKRIAQWDGENCFSCLYNSYNDFIEEYRSIDTLLTQEEFENLLYSQIECGTIMIQESENGGKVLVTTIIQ